MLIQIKRNAKSNGIAGARCIFCSHNSENPLLLYSICHLFLGYKILRTSGTNKTLEILCVSKYNTEYNAYIFKPSCIIITGHCTVLAL